MQMFNDIADEIFKKADVPKEGNEEVYDEMVEILSRQMAMASVTMGLSYKRGEFWEEQKQALVDDLLEGVKQGVVKGRAS